MLIYLHPLAGIATLALLLYVGLLGLQLRQAKRDRAALGQRHARLANVVYWAVLASWVGGVATTALDRRDLGIAASLHFRSGTLLVLLLSGSALTARALRRGNREAREWHPWLGVAAVLLAALHLVAGLRLTP
ncbi:MAG: DUF4079 family protein [Deltaproteobacteria bacterium]|nr:DUF4079 family protein [Deltaproteobacteria bacterium]